MNSVMKSWGKFIPRLRERRRGAYRWKYDLKISHGRTSNAVRTCNAEERRRDGSRSGAGHRNRGEARRAERALASGARRAPRFRGVPRRCCRRRVCVPTPPSAIKAHRNSRLPKQSPKVHRKSYLPMPLLLFVFFLFFFWFGFCFVLCCFYLLDGRTAKSAGRNSFYN